MDLLSGSESDTPDNDLKINKQYAKSYEIWRKREEKQRLMDKYGEDLSGSSSESEEEIRSSHMLDKEWLRAYAVVRFNQPRLYSGEKLFNEEVKPVEKKNEKKVTLKDHERKFVLEKGGVASDDDDENDDFGAQNAGPSYFEEQEEIKNSLKQAIGDIDDVEEKEDSLLVKKTKTKQQQKEEENEYLAWLKGERDDLEDKEAAEELAPLKAHWSNPNLTDKEKVLRDYILNNGYMDKEGSESEESEDDIDFDREEDFLDQADEHEQTYNFRHEEPGGIEIKTYPRVIETSVRAKEDNPRVEMRKRKMEKKQREKDLRLEEIKVLQRLQREEKEQKLLKLKKLSDNPGFEYDLDADFDPDEHNKMMKKHFDDSYYDEEGAPEKPVFEVDEADEDEAYKDETDDWWQSRSQAQMDVEEDLLANEEEGELHIDDPGFIMDADYDPNNTNTEKKSKKSKKEAKKEKKKKKLEKMPLFDPTTKSFDEYLDEYLQDKINTLPFTYREVVPNDFGLTTNEVFSATDKELNSWVSVKKMSMYRSDHEERQDISKFRAKSCNLNKKYKHLPSLVPKPSAPKSSKKKENKKKKKLAEKQENEEAAKDEALASECVVNEESPQKSPKIEKTKKRKHSESDTVDPSTDTPKSKKKRTDYESQSFKTDKPKVKKHSKGDKKVEKDSKKKNKLKKAENQELPKEKGVEESKSTTKEENVVDKEVTTKKGKKKKSKLRMDDDVNSAEVKPAKPVTTDKRKAKDNLRKVMSANRLSSYGYGPGAQKHAGKKNKKKKVVAADS